MQRQSLIDLVIDIEEILAQENLSSQARKRICLKVEEIDARLNGQIPVNPASAIINFA